MRIGFALLITLASVSGFAVQPAMAEPKARDQAVFAFGGRYVDAYIEHSLVPFVANYEDNFVLGAGYQKFLAEPMTDLHLGVEVGVALRGGIVASGEVWMGAVVRYDGLRLGENLRISPAITGGFSAITNPIGVEAERAQQRDGDPSLLFFMAPEISIATLDHPDTELFYRLQHRSGAWGTLGGMADGANAQVVGIRHHF